MLKMIIMVSKLKVIVIIMLAGLTDSCHLPPPQPLAPHPAPAAQLAASLHLCSLVFL